MAQLTLTARMRAVKGKGAVRKLRRDKQVPAVFYGPGSEPLMLTVHYADLQSIIKESAGTLSC